MDAVKLYRPIVREISRASILPRLTRPQTVALSFRHIFEEAKSRQQSSHFDHDIQNTVLFMHSQRMHKTLLERYNPLHDLTTEERVQATARRVGLDMPIRTPQDEEK